MAKFVIECPNCGKYAEAKTGFFARKKIDCSCGHTINVRTDKLTSRKCMHCGNDVVFDQSKGAAAKCPVCGEPINTMAQQSHMAEIVCDQCGVELMVSKAASAYTCPVCDCVVDVQAAIKKSQIKDEGIASVIKYEGDADTLIWKHPVEDFNMGSQLIVHESQEAIFFRNGQALDLFGAGRYTLETQQLPILEKFYQLPSGSDATFHSEVYFINRASQLAVKWGTPEKINFIDPLTGAPISVGARGVLNFRVGDSRKLLLKLVGTTNGLTREDFIESPNSRIQNYFRSAIQLVVSTNLAQAITSQNIDILQIDQQKLILSQAMMPVIQPYFADFGVEVTEFLVDGIVLPDRGDLGYDAVQTIIKLRQAGLTKSAIATEAEIQLAQMEAKKNIDVKAQQNIADVEIAHRGAVTQQGETSLLKAQYDAQKKVIEAQAEAQAMKFGGMAEAEVMRAKGYTEKDVLQADVQKAFAEGMGSMGGGVNIGGGSGNIGADMVGMMAGMKMAGMMMGQLDGVMNNAFAPAQTSPAQPISEGWNCTCGQSNITSAFCPSCGNKKPEPVSGWVCPSCGKTGITSAFCPDCGARKPEEQKGWNCTCGATDIKSNFCPQCGNKKPETPSTWNCPNCGATDITSNFCPQCGNKKA